MKIISTTIFLLIFCCKFSSSQVHLVKQWDKRYGGTANDWFTTLEETNDGGFIIGGYSGSGINGDKTESSWGIPVDYWIVKIDSLGNKQWDKRFGGTEDDNLYSVKQTVDGGYILGGTSLSGNSGDKSQTSQGISDYWIVKTDSLGNLQWDKRFGGSNFDTFSGLQQTTDKGYILGGSSTSINGDKSSGGWGGYDYWIIKIDSLGNKQWDATFGGTADDNMSCLQQTSDKGYILGGSSSSGIGGDKTEASWDTSTGPYYHGDYWIVKVDSAGNKQWDRRFGGLNSDGVTSLEQTPDGGYILGGTSNSGIGGDKTEANKGSSDYWVIKIDSVGNKQWEKDIGGSSGDAFVGTVFQTNDKAYVIVGTSQSPISGDKTENNMGIVQSWVVKMDSFGDKLWDKTIFTNSGLYKDRDAYGIQTKDGCYLFGNYTQAGIGGYKSQLNWDTTNKTFDYWIVKFCEQIIESNNEINNKQIEIFPNPATNQLTITTNTNTPSKIILYDIASRKLMEEKFIKEVSLNIAHLAKGIYIYQITDERGMVTRGKVVKE